jgi:putative Ca2+/H+ antiporter (TMEM165/GDT1 family)
MSPGYLYHNEILVITPYEELAFIDQFKDIYCRGIDMFRYLLAVFATIFLAELGDKTQFAVLLYATRTDVSKVGVAIAASLALITTTLIAVIVGDRLAHWIDPRILQGVAAGGFIVIGLIMLISVIKGS